VAAYQRAAEEAKDHDKGIEATRPMIKKMVEDIFAYVVHNSTDFMLAGYSFDLCLCDLKKISHPHVEKILTDFASALRDALADPELRNCILLAHWKAQSYWQENYTDFYDFCFCLWKHCGDAGKASANPKQFQGLQDHCVEVMKVLTKRSEDYPENPVLLAEFAGPDTQYSRGLSVFFPWAAPTADKTITKEYGGDSSKHQAGYRFNDTVWYAFLKQYWGDEPGTKREVHKAELDPITKVLPAKASDELLEDMASLMFNDQGPLNQTGTLGNEKLKVKPRDPTGDDECTCGSIKNYPHDTRPRRERSRIASDQSPPSSTTFF
jgi:hypothetical protein